MIPLYVFVLLLVKHFILDFLYQPPYQWKNKGTYGHWGGLVHAGQHGLGTTFVLGLFVSPSFAVAFGLLDAVIHYHVDWAKMNVNKHFGWGANTHEEFWWALGADQLAHQLTYAGIIWLAAAHVA